MRSFLVLSLAVSAHAASASYDLVLVADGGTASIHRFDGSTGSYLGQYGVGDFGPGIGSIAVNPALGLSYAMDFSRNALFIHNYSTGNLVGLFAVSGPRQISLANDGTLLIAGAGGARRYSATGSLLTTYTSVDSTSIFQMSDGTVYSVDTGITTPTLRRFTFAGTAAGTTALPTSAGFFYWQSGPWLNQGILTRPDANSFYRIASANPPTATLITALPQFVGVRCYAQGHTNQLYFGGFDANAPTQGLIQSFYWVPGQAAPFPRLKMGMGILQQPYSIAVVAAPEPLSIVGIAGALAIVVLRRKRS